MLMRATKPTPFAGELQTKVDELEGIFAIPSIRETAQLPGVIEKRRAAAAELEAVRTEAASILRANPEADNPKREAALRRIEAAEAKLAQARRVYVDVKAREAAAWERALLERLDQATPTMALVMQLVNEALNPAIDLAVHVKLHGVELPRRFAAIVEAGSALQALTAATNAATAPNREIDE